MFVPVVSNDASTVGLSARFAQIIGVLCHALGDYEARERTAGPFVFLIRQILRRRLGRFMALVERFCAGTLRPARPSAPSRVSADYSAREQFWDPMPRDRAWLWHLLPGVSAYVGLFEGLLADPDMTALLAAAPQAGRLLRPLWWIMSPDPLPEALRRPPRPPPRSRPASEAASASPASERQSCDNRSGWPVAEPPRPRIVRTRLVRPAYAVIIPE